MASTNSRNLPGCRPCGLDWDACKITLTDSYSDMTIHFRLGDVEWERQLKKRRRKRVPCNLQERQVLRWIAEEEGETDSAIIIRGYRVQYEWKECYPCIFPHQGVEAHDVVEIMENMPKENLKAAAEKSVRDHTVLLCPARAPTCWKRHPNVEKEVQNLAMLWPVRQTRSAIPVVDMIDITPVLICEDRDGCGKGRRRSADLPTEIWYLKDIPNLLDYLGWAVSLYKTKLNLPLHESWNTDIHTVTQHAVYRCKDRRATAHPTRLYDTQEKTAKCDLQSEHYIALSYCWGDWPDEEELKSELERLSQRLGIRYFWVDKWCIIQNDDSDKAREIHRMGEYYSGASACLVLTRRERMKHFQCVPQQDGVVLSSLQQVGLNRDAIYSLLQCEWIKRVWTLQETLLSRQVIYVIGDQLIDGDFITELMAYVSTGTMKIDPNDYGCWVSEFRCYRWDPRPPSVVYSRHISIERVKVVLIQSIFGGEQQYQELTPQGGKFTLPFEVAMGLASDRAATRQEDYIIGVLGVAERGNKIPIEYNGEASWKVILDGLRQAQIITERQLAAPSVSPQDGMSWLPDVGPNSIFKSFLSGDRLAITIDRPPLSWSEGRAKVLGVAFKWEEKEENISTNSIYGVSCNCVRGIIRFPGSPGLVAKVAATSSWPFGEWSLGDTQVMLCKDVDEYTQATVAIHVEGDIESGIVYRKGGYVLELHEWLEGNPRSLQGRHWILR